jgi:tRNA (mo5U34)-methyltransferase
MPAAQPSLRDEVARIRWRHPIDLGDGLVTPGSDPAPLRLSGLGLPERLDGLSVLDVGAWDGFFSFEAERRGAERVVATDWFCWGGPGWGTKEGFDLARRVLGSNVEDVEVDVPDLSPEVVGTHDLVLFLGVLYHLRDPLLALERVASVTRGTLVVETLVDMLSTRRPAAAFYPGAELNRDDTNWWGPNPRAVEGMLRAVGFRDVRMTYVTPLRDRLAHAAKRRRDGARFVRALEEGRAVFHARR